MITTQYTIESLTIDSVNIKTQRYYDNLPLGEPHRKLYVNNTQGRIDVQNELPQTLVNAIFAMWGAEPTVDDGI